MSFWKPLVLSTIAVAAFASTSVVASAISAPPQISIGIGVEPSCPYGYFDYAPYACSPYGYYGSDWFGGDGVFFGAGPWFHGPSGFRGRVDNRFDPHHGYHGPLPNHGDERFNHFNGNEARDGRGHGFPHSDHDGGGERSLPGYHGGGGDHGGGDHGGGGHDNGGHH